MRIIACKTTSQPSALSSQQTLLIKLTPYMSNMEAKHFLRLRSCADSWTNFFLRIIPCFMIFAYVPMIKAEFSMTLLHTGDIHARFQQFDKYAGTCSPDESHNGECYGGFARLAQAINDIREAESNVVVLDAGDIFAGTLWFTLYRGRASAYFMNLLGYDAQVSDVLLITQVMSMGTWVGAGVF